MTNKTIAVFGSGLSACFVRVAAQELGYETRFFTNKPFVPVLIPNVTLEWMPESVKDKITRYMISHFAVGNREDYLRRMGRDPQEHTSFPVSGRREFSAWRTDEFIEATMPPSSEVEVHGQLGDSDIEEIAKQFGWSFITFPLAQHADRAKLVRYMYYTDKYPEMILPNMMIYNGTRLMPWTRMTYYWGNVSWEYSHAEMAEGEPPKPSPEAKQGFITDIRSGVQEHFSPIPRSTLVGRWAQFNKKVLSHDAYKLTRRILEEL